MIKRSVAVAALAAGLWSGLTAPAGAIVINGHVDVAIGNPDTRIAVVGEMQPCIADGSMQPCIVEVDVRVDTRPSRS
ncbi:MAG TPA: hypothetical protein VJ777_26120 [Mycobacterium sp.]|nr:hypothetical protein [Mycobacterium sp.]